MSDQRETKTWRSGEASRLETARWFWGWENVTGLGREDAAGLQAAAAGEQQEFLRCLYPYGREVSRRESFASQLLDEQRDKIVAVFSEMIARAAGGDSYSVVGVMGLTRRPVQGDSDRFGSAR